MLRKVLKDIRTVRTVKFYAFLADETTDTSMNEQLSLSIRWVDDKPDIHEDPVELILAEDTSGEALANSDPPLSSGQPILSHLSRPR